MRYRLSFITGLAVGYVIGARAGRERYEELRAYARRLSENPAVRNTVETATHTGRQAASKAAHTVADRVGDRLPESVSEKVRAFNGRTSSRPADDDWGATNT
ncbi:YtxH domain-containing protein [Streptomyces sp. 549]|uniref:YtxH domain-containing protein n=1 Tax=Streptomyces sp. 549 TaxID=3049076 RepID=UPI0024C3D06B|nr:YtxH domain-containing protein [Streptomyces sp. 549]MDK1473887.1 YtxH domain-containing protein [Streptomyces sp. 549]